MSGTDRLWAASWPTTELARAVVELRRAVDPRAPTSARLRDVDVDVDGGVERWLDQAAAALEIEIEPVSSVAAELEPHLRRLGPALVRLPPPLDACDPDRSPRFLLLLAGGRRCRVLTPAGAVVRISAKQIAARLLAPRLLAEQADAGALLARLGLDAQTAQAFARERLSGSPIAGIFVVRPLPGAPPRVIARAIGLRLSFAILIVARALTTALFMLLFWLIGRDVFGVHDASPGLLALCAGTLVPLRLLDAWAQSRLALDVGAAIKEALLHGILRLDRRVVQSRGAGQFSSMAMEGEVSSNASEGALGMVTSSVELLGALVSLSLGVAAVPHVILLLGWVGFGAWLVRAYLIRAEAWAVDEQRLTHDLIERLVGYQTRLVQEPESLRHRDEDQLLSEYLKSSRALDLRRLPLGGLLGTGWLLIGLAVLEPALTSGTAPAAVAISIGGLLVSSNALRQLVTSVVHVSDVWLAWRGSAAILAAGAGADLRAVQDDASASPAADAPLLRFEALQLRHRADGPLVLRRCTGTILSGDRILLEGPSGGGKSTLALVLAGLREPDSGRVSVHDRTGPFIVAERVVLVPQFHDNHVLTASLLFNLLLGRGYPPQPADIAEAMRVCDRLGLSPLLAKMPQGPSQPIGDGGWALSHGERSRVFLARAILQERAELLILDESLAALDPETLVLAGRGVLETAPTLLVIAHP